MNRGRAGHPMLAVKTALVVAMTGAAACGSGRITEPGTRTGQLALTTIVSGKPALILQSTDGTGALRLGFAHVVDSIPGNGADLIARDDNLLALGSPRWDPWGQRVAVVATVAYDQSEIVVMDATGASGQVASVSSQIIASAPDWSPDGNRLAYTMSTLQGMAGLDLFVTDLRTHQVRRLTTGANLGRAVVRWSYDGNTIYIWHRLGETGGSAPNAIGDVIAVDVATGATTVVRSGFIGEVQDISAYGNKALVLRTDSLVGGLVMRDLLVAPFTGNVTQVVAFNEPMFLATWAAGWAAGEDHVVLVSAGKSGTGSVTYEWLQTSTGDRRILSGVAGDASVDLYLPPLPI